MLAIKLYPGQMLKIGDAEVKYLADGGSPIRLGVKASRDVPIDRFDAHGRQLNRGKQDPFELPRLKR